MWRSWGKGWVYLACVVEVSGSCMVDCGRLYFANRATKKKKNLSHSTCSSLYVTLTFHSSHQQGMWGSLPLNLDEVVTSRSDAVWPLRVGHKSRYCVHVVLLRACSLHPVPTPQWSPSSPWRGPCVGKARPIASAELPVNSQHQLSRCPKKPWKWIL